jgi:hypothetical protein
MNNPMKDEGLKPDEVDKKDLPRGFINANDCAKWMLKNFSKLKIHIEWSPNLVSDRRKLVF